MSRAFYVKCRPQGADVTKLVLDHKRVFIGYPPVRPDSRWDRQNVRRYLFDLGATEWDVSEVHAEPGYRRQVSMNRNFAREVKPGFMVVVPRPGNGTCLVGRITSSFELVSDPVWAGEYRQLREDAGLEVEPEERYLSDLVQTWRVEGWKTLPFAHIPRWITYRLLSRNTLGWIEDFPKEGGPKAADVLAQLYAGTYPLDLPPTLDPAEVEARLLNWVSPVAFEHLACDLLQLEHPAMRWWHIGGSGDGGVDGIGMTEGRVTHALQCKWKYDGDLVELGRSVQKPLQEEWQTTQIHSIVATLFSPPPSVAPVAGVEVWTRKEIARLLIKYHERCPMARTLGVGSP